MCRKRCVSIAAPYLYEVRGILVAVRRWECLAGMCLVAHFQHDWQLTICTLDNAFKCCLHVLSEILQLWF